MNELDKKIKEALAEGRDDENLFEEQSILSEAIAPFRGKRKWVNTLGLAYGIGGLALAIWSGYHFYFAEAVREQLLWGGLCALGVLFNAFIKVFFWMEMHSNRILREIKRVELLLAQKRDEG